MDSRTATCSCGQLTAIVTEDPVRISVCHCLACQRRTGSVFGAQARFRRHAVRIRGGFRQFVRIGDEGGRTIFAFCPACGATVYYQCEEDERRVAVPVGAFAEPNFPPPTVSVYEERKHPWVVMPHGIQSIE